MLHGRTYTRRFRCSHHIHTHTPGQLFHPQFRCHFIQEIFSPEKALDTIVCHVLGPRHTPSISTLSYMLLQSVYTSMSPI